MAEQRKILQKLKVGKDFRNDTTGIITTIKAADDVVCDDFSLTDFYHHWPKKDPVKAHYGKKPKRAKTPSPERPQTPETLINPSLSTRMDLSKPACMKEEGPAKPSCGCGGVPPFKYELPKPKGSRKAAKERREEERKNRLICEYTVLRLPSPTNLLNLQEFEMISPEVSKAKVMPTKPSATSKDLYPDPPTKKELDLHKPKSGIIINVTEEIPRSSSSGESSDEEKDQKKDKDKEDSDRLSTIEDVTDEDSWEEIGDEEDALFRNKATAVDEDQPLRMIRKVVSQTSRTTSLNSKDLVYEDVNWEQIPAICKLVQTFRSEQDKTAKKKKVKRGTLENHSFTKLKQKTIEEFCFKCLLGSIHQGDDNFPLVSRNRQGICMPVAAYCYAKLVRPEGWNEKTVDDVLEIGNRFYLDSISTLHMHKGRKELNPKELQKTVAINGKKVKYEIDDPEVSGQIRSLDKKIFNLTKGLKIFFHRHKAALFQASEYSVSIWKHKKHFYIFDATPRRKDIYQDPNGKACLICVQNLKAVISILLDRTTLENSTFMLYRMKVIKVMNFEDPDEDIVDAGSVYNILNDRKAVVQGNFDLGDKCFNFTRNEQALPMATVALVYSRITCPATWRRKTVDKIMLIGNQLCEEILKHKDTTEIGLDSLPAVFTIGPYIVEVYIYANCYADNMFKKGQCSFCEILNQFFEKNNNAIVQIGKSTIAIWRQRNMIYCFDPYSRNREGLKCRNGAAAVSMNADMETLLETIISNFEDPEVIFYIHALKVIKIHRDPAMSRFFPKSLTLNEVPIDNFRKAKLRKSKKKALEKPIRTNFTEYALKKLLTGDSPGGSMIDIGSNIGSLNSAYLPPFMHKVPPKEVIKTKLAELNEIADLDSPALSETQIVPVRPTQLKNEEEITLMDLDSYDLTQEELELRDEGEGEEEEGRYMKHRIVMVGEGYEDEEGEEDYYLATSVYSQVNSSSLESTHQRITEEINTDITYCYKILPTLETEIKSKKDPEKALVIDKDIQEEELKIASNYEVWHAGMQPLWGNKTLGDWGERVNDVTCYLCIMAAAYSQELGVCRWSKKSVDFVLKSGTELYQTFEEPYTRVEDFHLEFKKYAMDVTLETVLDTYVEERLLLSEAGSKTLEAMLVNYIFSKSNIGLIFMTDFNCAIFFKRHLLYVFDPNDQRKTDDGEMKRYACMVRFKDMDCFIAYILAAWNNNMPQRDTDFCKEYTRVVLIRPHIDIPGRKGPETLPSIISDAGEILEPDVTQSVELAKPNNFIDLPDGTQLIRGTTEIRDFGEAFEQMAPYVCIMAPAVGYKYSVSTWSGEVVNYVIQCGVELFKKSKIKFEEIAKLEIPKVALGKTDCSMEVNYRHDGQMKHEVVMAALKKILKQNGEWAIIVTQEFACAAYYKNHLYYLFDCYASNEVGLSEGPDAGGYASFSRFKDLHSLTTRLIYNKNKREDFEKLEYTRFVLSTVKVKRLVKEQKKKKRKKAKDGGKKTDDDDEEEEEDESLLEQEGVIDEDKPERKKKKPKRPEEEEEGEIEEEGEEEEEEEKPPKNKVGFFNKDGYFVIEGTKSLADSKAVSKTLKEDHFVCLCACLMVINYSVKKWDTKKVDLVIDQGKHIYSHATNLEISDKRTIKNILVYKHYFDIIVRPIKINNWRKNKNIDVGLKTIFSKRKFCLVQFPNACIVVYKEDKNYYLFSPYSWTYKNTDNEEKTVNAGWVLYSNEKQLRRKVKSFMVKDGNGNYAFYSFEVISLRKAPKKDLIGQKLMLYEVDKPKKQENMGKPFHEQRNWLNIPQYPWSRMKDETASGRTRGKRDARWHNWDIEYTDDLYSLVGNLHQTSRKFCPENRGKQTLSNLVVAIAMTNIYELSEWNAAILDSILVNGDHYFNQCVEDIKEENYELTMDDLLEDCSIFPYTFKVAYTPAIEGTMFLTNVKKFNLYKALRYFFENYESRCGMIVAFKGPVKRWAAFGKTQENEYFMYDCQSMGPPMFFERQGASYILRCVTLARLLHVLILTLKGGDFYIYDVETYAFEPMN